MNLKLILSGIALAALLVACNDRNDEETSTLQSQSTKTDLKEAKATKIIRDTIKKPNEPDSKDGPAASANETIDPTKPDRPK